MIGHPAFDAVAHGRRLFDAVYCGWGLSELWIFARDRAKVAGRREDRGSLFVLVPAILAAMGAAFALARFGQSAIALPPASLLAGGTGRFRSGSGRLAW